MATGLPVVTSKCPALEEVAGDAALFVPVQDRLSLAHGMIRALEDESLRARLSQRGRARAKRYDWQRTAAQTLEVYREVGGFTAPGDSNRVSRRRGRNTVVVPRSRQP